MSAALRNPTELLIFGNPKRARRNAGDPREEVRQKMEAARKERDAATTAKARKKAYDRFLFLQDQLESMKEHAKKNPQELLIFNPSRKKFAKRKRRNGNANHKPGCKCFACKHARGEKKHNPKKRSAPRERRRAISKIARRSRRNPSEAKQAVKLFESFHGKEPKEISELQVSAAMRQDYTCLGDCLALGLEDGGMTPKQLALRWRDANHIGFEGDKVKLASSPNGKQLYLIGGNQNLSGTLAKWKGIDRAKDFIDLGECFFVTYLARNIHPNFEPTEWTHAFGEKGGTLPRLAFDQLRNQIFFIGGEYFIDLKDVSPGIEN